MDFGSLPVFESATAYPCIFIWQKLPRRLAGTDWAMVKDLTRCYAEGVRNHLLGIRVKVPAEQFGKGKPRLATSASADLRAQMEKSGPRLGELVQGKICRGIVTGFNRAFVINTDERNALIRDTPEAVEIIKPLITGEDIRKYEIQDRGNFLI